MSAPDSARRPDLRHGLPDPLLDAPTNLRSERVALEIMDASMTRRLHRDFERIRDGYGESAVERLVLGRSSS